MVLPLLHPSGIARRAIAWNAQWLLNTGITEIPVTLDDFEAAFRAFRNDDPDGNGSRDTFPMTAPGDREDAPKGFFDEFFGAFGTFPYEWVEKDGKLVYGFTDPGLVQRVQEPADVAGLVYVVEASLPDTSEGLDADGEPELAHGGILRRPVSAA